MAKDLGLEDCVPVYRRSSAMRWVGGFYFRGQKNKRTSSSPLFIKSPRVTRSRESSFSPLPSVALWMSVAKKQTVAITLSSKAARKARWPPLLCYSDAGPIEECLIYQGTFPLLDGWVSLVTFNGKETICTCDSSVTVWQGY